MIITDFDQTLCRLVVDWPGLRRQLGVQSIGALWSLGDLALWKRVTDAEVIAATSAVPIEAVLAELDATDRFAVMSNNSAAAVTAFVERFPTLEARCRMIVGREQLRGPKQDPARFDAAFRQCAEALGAAVSTVEYFGDQRYELELAAARGARVRLVTSAGAIERLDAGEVGPAAP
jgi:phosphoglycolate phosphatase-like HAD superfamily hydrolase